MPLGIKITHSSCSQRIIWKNHSAIISPSEMNDASFTSLSDPKHILVFIQKCKISKHSATTGSSTLCANNESLSILKTGFS